LSRQITKKLASFTIDKDVLKRFDEIVFNNEKSLVVENFMIGLIQEYPKKVPSLKHDLYEPDKRGVQNEVTEL